MKNIIFSRRFDEHIFCVYKNRPLFSVLEVNQIHSNINIHTNIIKDSKELISADGIIFNNKNDHPITIKTADCLPIFLYGKETSALIHAGWKGLKSQILLDPQLTKMNVKEAFIGPHINKCCFEVGADFIDHFPKKYFNKEVNSSKTYCDLYQIAHDQLQSINPSMKIENANICTCCHEDFHSYRQNKTIKRNWNTIKKL